MGGSQRVRHGQQSGPLCRPGNSKMGTNKQPAQTTSTHPHPAGPAPGCLVKLLGGVQHLTGPQQELQPVICTVPCLIPGVCRLLVVSTHPCSGSCRAALGAPQLAGALRGRRRGAPPRRRRLLAAALRLGAALGAGLAVGVLCPRQLALQEAGGAGGAPRGQQLLQLGLVVGHFAAAAAIAAAHGARAALAGGAGLGGGGRAGGEAGLGALPAAGAQAGGDGQGPASAPSM